MELIIKPEVRITGRVEICRSFTYKKNVGNYESRDFFCSQRAECAAEDMEATGELLYAYCKSQVLRSVAAWEEYALAQFSANPPQRRTA